jgi:hypothetical protein
MSIFLKKSRHTNPLGSALKLLIWLAIPCAAAAYGGSLFHDTAAAKKQLAAILASVPSSTANAPAASLDGKGRFDGGQGDARTRVMRIIMQTQGDSPCIIDARFQKIAGQCDTRAGWLMSTLRTGDSSSKSNSRTQYNLSRKENGNWITYAIIYPSEQLPSGKTKTDERANNNYPSILGDLISG